MEAEDILRILQSRHVAVSSEQHTTVSTCTDLAQLDVWFDRALTATTADEVFKP